jgi:hypothetical protein
VPGLNVMGHYVSLVCDVAQGDVMYSDIFVAVPFSVTLTLDPPPPPRYHNVKVPSPPPHPTP